MTLAKDLEKIVGKTGVITDKKALKIFKRDANGTGVEPVCIVKPKTAEAVQKIVQLANKKGFFLIPRSSQGNSSHVDLQPIKDPTVIVDLSAMNHIVRIDKRNKVALVEPGVTFGQLIKAAAKQDLRAATPLRPRKDKSVIGSILEREPTMIPKYHWDFSDPLCCMEVIFGTGDKFRTGSASGPGDLEAQWASGQAQKSPMGPSQNDWAKLIQGAQGTLGIVTWTSIKLENLPQAEKCFLVGSKSLAELIDYTYAIVKPRLTDLVFILNKQNVSALLGSATNDLPPWMMFYSIAGYLHRPQERVVYIEKDIADIAAARGIAVLSEIKGVVAGRVISLASHPSEELYWKNRPQGAFKDIFFLSTLDRAVSFVKIMEEEAAAAGFPAESLGIYLQPIHQGRACHVEFTMMYHPEEKQETETIDRLFASASKRMIDQGGFFTRPYGEWTKPVYARCPDTVAALKKVKGILDPQGVMNPGKLCFEIEE